MTSLTTLSLSSITERLREVGIEPLVGIHMYDEASALAETTSEVDKDDLIHRRTP